MKSCAITKHPMISRGTDVCRSDAHDDKRMFDSSQRSVMRNLQ